MTALLGTALTIPLAACGSPSADDGVVEITFLTPNDPVMDAASEALVEKFNETNPDIHVTHETQSAADNDNLTKTKLATGEMAEVFNYNAGSPLMTLNPDQNLVDLSDQAWVSDMTDDMRAAVSTDGGLYGAPLGPSQAGAVLYNKKIYEELSLEIPTSWKDFSANNEKIKAAGKAPIVQTYGEAYTAQMFLLGDFGNVAAQDPDWAAEYTAGNRSFAEEPAIQGFKNQEEAGKAGWFNEDFASAMGDDGYRMLATGEGAHLPWLTSTITAIEQNYPDNVDDIGVFALPAQNADDTRLTVWLPNAVYIPKTAEGDKLEAAKKFVEFVNSPDGCAVQSAVISPSGPYSTSACTLADDVPALIDDIQAYYDADATVPALEYLSPVKGPNLANLMVEVGSGIRGAEDAAKLYDEDVKKQAQQLGLEGW